MARAGSGSLSGGSAIRKLVRKDTVGLELAVGTTSWQSDRKAQCALRAQGAAAIRSLSAGRPRLEPIQAEEHGIERFHRDSRPAALCSAGAAAGAGRRGRALEAAPALGLPRLGQAADAVSRQPHAARLRGSRSRPGHRLCLLRLRGNQGRDRRRLCPSRNAIRTPPHARRRPAHRPTKSKRRCCAICSKLLLNSPQVDRIESQLLLHPSGTHAAIFREAGFELFRRLFMVQPLTRSLDPPALDLPARAGAAPLARRRSGRRRPPHLRGLSRPSRQPHQRPVPLRARLACAFCTTSSATPAAEPSPRTSRTSSSSAPAANWWPWCWVRASARRAATSPSSACIRLPAPGPGPHAALRGRVAVHAPGRQRNLPHCHRSQHRGHRTLPAEGYDCAHTFDAAVWQRDMSRF